MWDSDGDYGNFSPLAFLTRLLVSTPLTTVWVSRQKMARRTLSSRNTEIKRMFSAAAFRHYEAATKVGEEEGRWCIKHLSRTPSFPQSRALQVTLMRLRRISNAAGNKFTLNYSLYLAAIFLCGISITKYIQSRRPHLSSFKGLLTSKCIRSLRSSAWLRRCHEFSEEKFLQKGRGVILLQTIHFTVIHLLTLNEFIRFLRQRPISQF